MRIALRLRLQRLLHLVDRQLVVYEHPNAAAVEQLEVDWVGVRSDPQPRTPAALSRGAEEALFLIFHAARWVRVTTATTITSRLAHGSFGGSGR